MPSKVSPNQAQVVVHGQVPLSGYRQQYFLQESNVLFADDNRELTPVQYISKWKVIIIGNYNRNATIMYSITDPCSVHLITFHMQAVFAPSKSFFIRE